MSHLKIGNLTLKNNLVMAPMAGYTDWPFRQLLTDFKCSLAFTEMISAKALTLSHPRTTKMLLHETEKMNFYDGIQLFGGEISSMVAAAQTAQDAGYQVVDINVGCPCPKVTKSGSGSILLKSPEKLGKLFAAMRKVIKVPFTAKMRIGWDQHTINGAEIARIAEQEGIDALFVHGRTRSAGFSGKPDLKSIKLVKDAVKIPVFGNGDIKDTDSALKMLSETGCDGLMIGRYAFEDPWLFDRIDAAIKKKPIPELPSLKERLKLLEKLCRLISDHYGPGTGAMRSKRALLFCLRNFNGASAMRKKISAFKHKKEFETFFHDSK